MSESQARAVVRDWAIIESQGGSRLVGGPSGPFKGEMADVEEAKMTTEEMMMWKRWGLVEKVLTQWKFLELFRTFLRCSNSLGAKIDTFRAAKYGHYEPANRQDAICLIQIMEDHFWPLLRRQENPILDVTFVDTE